MKQSASNSIQKVFLEVNVGSTSVAYALKDRLEDFLRDEVFPYIESYFESLEMHPAEEVQIEHITLDLTADENPKIADLVPQIKEQLEAVFVNNEQHGSRKSKTELKVVPALQKRAETLIYFLEHGTFPWWVEDVRDPLVSVDAMLYNCIEDVGFREKLVEILNKEEVRKRMVLQFSDAFIGLLLPKLTSSTVDFLKKESLVQSIGQLPRPLRQHVWTYFTEISIGLTSETFHTRIGRRPELITALGEKETSILESIGDEFLKSRPVDMEIITEQEEVVFVPSEGDTETEVAFVMDRVDMDTTDSSEMTGTSERTAESEIVSEQIEVSKVSDTSETQAEEAIKTSVDDDKVTKKRSSEADPEDTEGLVTVTLSEEKMHSEKNVPEDLETPTSVTESSDIEAASETNNMELFTGESYYVSNAGLVLLHPFIKPFFGNCNLIDGKQINDHHTAIHLLHYLATGKEQEFEHRHIVEKFLCGVPPHFTVDREIELSQEHKDKSAELLESVLGHLQQFKSTSITLLQNEFLQRPGKLVLEEGNAKMIVERKTQDILLDNLPWNITMVKLPWHKKLFFVDW